MRNFKKSIEIRSYTRFRRRIQLEHIPYFNDAYKA